MSKTRCEKQERNWPELFTLSCLSLQILLCRHKGPGALCVFSKSCSEFLRYRVTWQALTIARERKLDEFYNLNGDNVTRDKFSYNLQRNKRSIASCQKIARVGTHHSRNLQCKKMLRSEKSRTTVEPRYNDMPREQ